MDPSRTSKPPQDIPPHDYAVIRSAGSMITWEGAYWAWHGGDWVYRGEAGEDNSVTVHDGIAYRGGKPFGITESRASRPKPWEA